MADSKVTGLAITTTGAPLTDLLEVVRSGVNYKIPWDDFFLFAHPDVYAKVYRSTDQTISTATTTAIEFDTAEYDPYSFWEGVVNPERLTIPSGYGGLYAMVFNVKWDTHITGQRNCGIYAPDTQRVTQIWSPVDSVDNPTQQSVLIYELEVAEWAEARVYQDRGGDLDVLNDGILTPSFEIMRIGRRI